jgi:hypothetical protein
MKRLLFIFLAVLITFTSISGLSASDNETRIPEIMKTEEKEENEENKTEEHQVPEEGTQSEDNKLENKTQEEDEENSEKNSEEEDQKYFDDYQIDHNDSLFEPWG